jgi:hypothetical protein
VGNLPHCVVAADVNGNGKPDLICANSGTNTLTVLTNNGTGIFGVSDTYTVGLHPYSLVAVDVNLDGKLDLVCINEGDDTLTVLTNNGNGTFTFAATQGVGSAPFSLVASDVNGDGKLGMIMANDNSPGTLSVLISSPKLLISPSNNNAIVWWPSSWTNWTLLQNSDLTTTNWTVSGGISDDGTNKSFAIPSPSENLFFRLSHP